MGFALAMLLALSITATGLMAVAGNELRGVRAAERDEAERLALHGAAMLGGAALATEPNLRTIAFQGGRAAVQVAGRTVLLTASWESDRLDVNLAPIEDITAALEAARTPAADIMRVADTLRMLRSSGEPVRSLEAVLEGVESSACIRAVLTADEGRASLPENGLQRSELGWPGAGSRLRLLAEFGDDGPFRAYEYVILITGNPTEPVQIIDLRPAPERADMECMG